MHTVLTRIHILLPLLLFGVDGAVPIFAIHLSYQSTYLPQNHFLFAKIITHIANI